MLGKQFIIDLIVVISIPVLVIGGYFFFFRADTTSLSVSQTTTPETEPGYKTKVALETLRSIRLDGSLFTDPSFLVLKPYIYEIPDVPLYRQYPFTTSPEVRDALRRMTTGTQTTR